MTLVSRGMRGAPTSRGLAKYSKPDQKTSTMEEDPIKDEILEVTRFQTKAMRDMAMR